MDFFSSLSQAKQIALLTHDIERKSAGIQFAIKTGDRHAARQLTIERGLLLAQLATIEATQLA